MAESLEPELVINEIFFSLQGEAKTVGYPTVFVRLTGCPLRCTWCDTEYAFAGGEKYTVDELLSEVAKHPTRHVCVTGGEPLAQRHVLPLLVALCDAGYDVSLETSGAYDISVVDQRVSRVMDLKAPGSKESERNRWENLQHLTVHDQLKIVVADAADFEWLEAVYAEHQLADRCEVFVSPVFETLEPAVLAEWVLKSNMQLRMQIQLHKYIWGDKPGV